MDLKNIIMSAEYLEFINKLDNIAYEILYSDENGYINLTSKEAVFEAKNKILEFEKKIEILKKDVFFENSGDIIKSKREKLAKEVKKHYEKQALLWCEEIYEETIENILTEILINKDDKETIDINFQKALSLISWIVEVKGLNEYEENLLLNDFNQKFDKTLKNKRVDFVSKMPEKSDESLFLKFYNLIISNEEEFLNIIFEEYSQKLITLDINYLKQLQNELKTYKNTQIKDEILIILSGVDILNLKNDKDKYDFILQVRNDFSSFKFENKKITKEDKISLVKTRIQIFKENLNSKNSLNYFKKLINDN